MHHSSNKLNFDTQALHKDMYEARPLHIPIFKKISLTFCVPHLHILLQYFNVLLNMQ